MRGVWILAVLGSFTLQAANIYVATDGNNANGTSWTTAYTSLKAAAQAAANGDTIHIKQGAYSLSEAVRLTGKNLTILGGYSGDTPEPGDFSCDPALTLLDASAQSRIFWLETGASAHIERLSVRNGRSNEGAGIYATNSTLAMFDCNVESNHIYTTGRGGGLHAGNCTLELQRCKIRNNLLQGTARGGGIYQYAGTALLEDCDVSGNNNSERNENGAGLYTDKGSLTLRRCKIRNNTIASTGVGGAIYLRDGAIDAESCWINGNYAMQYSGAIYIQNALSARFFNTLVANNVNPQANGNIYIYSGNAEFANCTMVGNSPVALERRAGDTTVRDSIFWNNGKDLLGVIGAEYSCIQDTAIEGEGVIYSDPAFTNDLRLGNESPCINAGSDTAENIGLHTAYAQSAVLDTDLVDLGYHHATPYTVTELYVSPSGTDAPAHGTAPGSGAFRSITYALSQAGDYTTINIEPGVYDNNTETFPLLMQSDNLTLAGDAAGGVALDASDADASIINAFAVFAGKIANLTLTGANLLQQSVMGLGIYSQRSGLTVTDCSIEDNRGTSRYNHGVGLYMDGGAVELRRCRIRNNRAANSSYGAAAYRSYGHLLLRDSIVANNRADLNSYGAAIVSAGEGSLSFRNCLVANNHSQSHASIYHNGGSITLANVTLVDNSPFSLYIHAGPGIISNTIAWGSAVNISNRLEGTILNYYSCLPETNYNGPGVIREDPLFGPLYHLSENSPCIDACGDDAETLELDGTYAQPYTPDSGLADMGFHYPEQYQLEARYVSTLGEDLPEKGTGPNEDAYQSLTYALGQVSDNTRIFLEEGVYDASTETFPITLQGLSGVQIIGASGASSVLDASGSDQPVMIISNAFCCIISNIAITGGSPPGEDYNAGAGLILHLSKAKLSDCDIHDNTVPYRRYGGGIHHQAGDLELLRCKIRNNTAASTTIGGGIYAVKGNLLMRECVVADNQVPSNRSGGGLAADTMGIMQAINCLFIRNSASGGSGGIYTSAGINVSFTNCTLAANTGGGYFNNKSPARVWNSIAWDNDVSDLNGAITVGYTCFGIVVGIADLIGNANIDPQWADEEHFHLQSALGQYTGGFFDGGCFLEGPDTSPFLDDADPACDYSRETKPSLGLERGAYGNTPSASLSPIVGFMLSVY